MFYNLRIRGLRYSQFQDSVSERLEKAVLIENGMLALSDSEMKDTWKCYHERLLNGRKEIFHISNQLRDQASELRAV